MRTFGREGRSVLRSERGIALPMALGIMLALSVSIATVIEITTANGRSASRDQGRLRAEAIAEAGLNRASAVLFNSTDPFSANAVGSGSESMDGGTSGYSGTLVGNTWNLMGTGSVPSPVAGAAPLTRTVTRQVTVGITPNSPWYYNFSDSTSGCMDLKKDAILAGPLIVRGNLCLAKDSHVTGSPFEVGGTLTLGNGSTVGYPAPGSPVAEAHLVGGCTGGATHPCTTADGVYVTSLSTTSLGLMKPTVDLPYWYANAKPGPNQGCTVGAMAGGFDNDGTGPNASRATFNLMPASSYDCRVTDGSGTIIGRLTWAAGSPGTLTVAGTIFFDGSIDIAANASGVYQGRGTIYASGSISAGKTVRLCGVAACDATWSTGSNMLGLVAGGSFDVEKDAIFQTAIYVVGDFQAKKDAAMWGPIIANQLDFEKDAMMGVTPAAMPPGIPGTATTLTPTAGSWRG